MAVFSSSPNDARQAVDLDAKDITRRQFSYEPKERRDESIITADPFEPLAFPYYRLDLTPESKLANNKPRWLASVVPPLRRRRTDMTYFDGPEYISSSAIMARLWQIAADGIPMTAVFPRAQHPITVRQFVDLVDFVRQHHHVAPDEDDDDDSSPPPLEASYEEIDGMPAVRFFCSTPNNTATTLNNKIDKKQQPQQNYNASTIERRIQAWVNRVLVKLQICPFTKSVKYSGQGAGPSVPVASIYYGTSHAQTVSQILADIWRCMDDMLVAGPTNISSILLAAPNFDDRFPLWSGVVFTVLEHSVMAARATDTLGVVCFHPLYQTPDGSSFPGFGHMHSVTRLQRWCNAAADNDNDDNNDNDSLITMTIDRRQAAAGGAWQRRTPHAVINVLRAEQLIAAESLRNTPHLYRDNIRKLLAIADELPNALAHERQLE
jgi:hypothetical protein